MTNAKLTDPTRCYIDGCDLENELVLHVADDPWLGGDYCIRHARELAASTPLIMTCDCSICDGARRVLGDDNAELLAGPGRWLVTTETSSYLIALDETGTGALVRDVGAYERGAPEAAELHPAIAVSLRRDGEFIPVLSAEIPVIGKPWVVLLDIRGDGISTRRQTTIVRSIVRDPELGTPI